MSVATAVLGAEPLHGSLVLSFINQILQNSGKPLCGIEFPGQLPNSDLPFIERMATEDCMIDDLQMQKGTKWVLYLGSFENERREIFFWRREHCPWESRLTEKVWKILAAELQRSGHDC